MNILTVTQLNFYVKTMLDSDPNLRSVFLKGEISNFKNHYSSGHLYLSLKDEKSTINAMMYANNASRLKFRPENGLRVIVRGYVSMYSVSGQYQFYIEDMQPDGVGSLNLAFEQLKKKLSAEGLFDQDHKKPIPVMPKRIAVITSPTGAAIQDIMRILKRRYPLGEIVICPVLVQGDNAAVQLTEAVKKVNRLHCADVIIIGRGGGSTEDLWAFNDEGLARAVYESEIPIVSAVGHETDFTICDFVSDLRASTPSAAAELVSPEEGELSENLIYFRNRITELISAMLAEEKQRLDILSNNINSAYSEKVSKKRAEYDYADSKIKSLYTAELSKRKNHFVYLNSKLDALSPLRVLSRGYSITEKNNKIASAKDIDIGDNINIIFSDGEVKCIVTERNMKSYEKDI